MAVEYSENEIVFENVKNTGIGISSKPIIFMNEGIYDPGVDNFGGIVNVVDIDWNGAKLGEHTINTTSDLLTLIKTINANVNDLSARLTKDITTEPTEEPTSPGTTPEPATTLEPTEEPT